MYHIFYIAYLGVGSKNITHLLVRYNTHLGVRYEIYPTHLKLSLWSKVSKWYTVYIGLWVFLMDRWSLNSIMDYLSRDIYKLYMAPLKFCSYTVTIDCNFNLTTWWNSLNTWKLFMLIFCVWKYISDDDGKLFLFAAVRTFISNWTILFLNSTSHYVYVAVKFCTAEDVYVKVSGLPFNCCCVCMYVDQLTIEILKNYPVYRITSLPVTMKCNQFLACNRTKVFSYIYIIIIWSLSNVDFVWLWLIYPN